MNTILELKNVTKAFGGLLAVNRVNLKVNKGELVGLIGPNGAGKTTLFSLVSGYLKPSEGEIYFEGKQYGNMKCHQLCLLGVTRTFQIVQPFLQLTTLENVMVGAFNRTKKVEEAKAKASEICNFLGLSHLKEVQARNLNLADTKRLEIARALATEPKILLLDEVIAGLNPTEVGRLIRLIRQIHQKGLTILIVEHVMKAIMELSERIVVLHHGQKISDGPPEKVCQDPKVIESYLGGKVAFPRS